MKIPKSLRNFCAIFMSVILTNLPAHVFAESKMISTTEAVMDMTRTSAHESVQKVLENNDVRQALIDQGLTPDEVSKRLASLSDTEMRQLAGQIEQARYGGDVLVTILIVVLIIFLIKRI